MEPWEITPMKIREDRGVRPEIPLDPVTSKKLKAYRGPGYQVIKTDDEPRPYMSREFAKSYRGPTRRMASTRRSDYAYPGNTYLRDRSYESPRSTFRQQRSGSPERRRRRSVSRDRDREDQLRRDAERAQRALEDYQRSKRRK